MYRDMYRIEKFINYLISETDNDNLKWHECESNNFETNDLKTYYNYNLNVHSNSVIELSIDNNYEEILNVRSDLDKLSEYIHDGLAQLKKSIFDNIKRQNTKRTFDMLRDNKREIDELLKVTVGC